ncbi:MAG: hypothetical protein ACQEXN_00855 [Actinomycetota bacterium]
MREKQERRDDNSSEAMERIGPKPLHGMGRDLGMPNLAAAQIPGPGTGHVVAGEDRQLPDDAADPMERDGHIFPARRARRWIPWSRGTGRHRLA